MGRVLAGFFNLGSRLALVHGAGGVVQDRDGVQTAIRMLRRLVEPLLSLHSMWKEAMRCCKNDRL